MPGLVLPDHDVRLVACALDTALYVNLRNGRAPGAATRQLAAKSLPPSRQPR